MQKWIVGALALAGAAFVAQGAMAQSEFGKPTWRGWYGEESQYDRYTLPTDPNQSYLPAVPGNNAFRPAPPVGGYFFSPPAPDVALGPASCGEFFYWSDTLGRCVDARLR